MMMMFFFITFVVVSFTLLSIYLECANTKKQISTNILFLKTIKAIFSSSDNLRVFLFSFRKQTMKNMIKNVLADSLVNSDIMNNVIKSNLEIDSFNFPKNVNIVFDNRFEYTAEEEKKINVRNIIKNISLAHIG